MSSRLLSLLLVVPMLLHGVFGCCWHHDHGAAAEHSGHSTHSCEAQHHGDLLVSHSSATIADEPMSFETEPSQEQGCSEQRCDYVATDRVRLETGKAVTALPLVSLLASTIAGHVAAPVRLMPAASKDPGAKLRPHARCQVWLI